MIWRPPPPLDKREVARHSFRATHRSGFPNQPQPSHVHFAQKSMGPLCMRSRSQLLTESITVITNYFSKQAPSHGIRWLFTIYVCEVTLGAWCPAPRCVTTVVEVAVPAAPRPPRPADTLECGHGRPKTWTAAVFGRDHCQAFTFDRPLSSSKSPM